MANKRIKKYFGYAVLLSLTILIVSCASGYKIVDLKSNTGLVWPAKPEQARIAHVASFYHPEQLGIKKGFVGWLSEVFSGEAQQRLIRPMAITKTSGNVLFVADPGAKGVHRFDLTKKRYALIRGENELALPSPVGLSTDQYDNVYIVDSELAQLFRINKNSHSLVKVELDKPPVQPTSVTVGTDSIFITDTASHHVKQYSLNGKLLGVIGKRGTAEGEFNYPTSVWRDKSGQLYVTDALNFRIQVFDREGKYVSSFGQAGTGTGNLSRPKGVATDQYGHVYVVDALFHVFQLFSQKGDFLLHIGGQGQNNGEFWLPTGIYISVSNEIYIADSHNRRIQVFRYIGGSS